jgi:two-component system aerobic respiration control protein ArcA
MSGSKSKNNPPKTIAEGRRSIRKQVENLKRKRISEHKIISLKDYREQQSRTDSFTVLVVDDEEVMRNAMKRVLEGENYNVLCALDGEELAKILEKNTIDVILLDVNLPWVDGIELCQMIKSHQVLASTPVILISGRKNTDDIQRGIAAGAADYITKPFDVDFLLDAVSKHIKLTG